MNFGQRKNFQKYFIRRDYTIPKNASRIKDFKLKKNETKSIEKKNNSTDKKVKTYNTSKHAYVI